jgi:carboxylesterase type B
MSRLALLSGVATLVSGLHLTDELYNTFSPKNVESNQYVESELEFVLLGDGTRLKGIREDDVVTFKGIPYAEPPINELRWSPPVQWTNKNVTDIFDATRFRNSCIQGKERWEIGNEDCLYLNVYAPPVSAKSLNLLPVAVYIHGGSYVTGGGSMYSGKDLVSYWNEQAIVVTINYRLNVISIIYSTISFSYLNHHAGIRLPRI